MKFFIEFILLSHRFFFISIPQDIYDDINKQDKLLRRLLWINLFGFFFCTFVGKRALVCWNSEWANDRMSSKWYEKGSDFEVFCVETWIEFINFPNAIF